MIVPGSPSALLLASVGDPLDELGKIDKSLRLRAAASAYLSRSPATTTSQLKWTFSGWIKRSDIGAGGTVFSASISVNDVTNIGFTSTAEIVVTHLAGELGYNHRITLSKFRDNAAWMHLVVVWDTANAVASDRIIIYVNGVRQSCSEIAIAQNTTSWINTTQGHRINTSIAYGGYGDLYIAAYAFVDGQALDPSYFGQFHPRTAQWRPKSRAAIKAVVDAGGVNSFFLPFDDATSLATLTADASAKGSNWTANNISLTAGVTYDSMLDTPTTNFATLDSSFANYGAVAGAISDGGLKFSSSTTYHFTPCTIPLPRYGKWQAEFIPQDTVSFIGLADLDNGSGASQNIGGGYGWYSSGLYTGNASVVQSGLAAMAANDIVTVTADMDALSMKIYKNGALVCTQALTSGKRYAFACGDYYAPGATSCFANFGQRAFSYPQSGYLALSAKNLKYPAVPKSLSAFVAVTATGANIAATLAAARAGWSGYIDIIKRRDAAEGWRWIFSDDASNYLDSSSTAAKAAVPAFGGTSYVGYSLRVAAANGVATGRLTHVNGAADVVADALANVRKVVILKNEATGVWYFYHPELTAGRLLYLEQTAGETVDATISAVTSSGFTVAAALASGTYRWISIAETDGLCDLSSDTGSGAADGPVEYLLQSPAMMIRKAVPVGTRWINWDNARNPTNLTNNELYPNFPGAENSAGAIWDIDMRSNGFKLREYTSGNTEFNYPGYKFITLSFAAFPFRYANAR